CLEAERLEAYFDGETDGPTALAVEAHLAGCAECSAALAQMRQLRNALREEAPYHRAPPALRARIVKEFGTKPQKPARLPFRRFSFGTSFAAGLGSGALAAGLVVGLGLFLMRPVPSEVLAGALIDAHMRALVSDHLVDVASSEHHTVKPWFEGRGDVSPPVGD